MVSYRTFGDKKLEDLRWEKKMRGFSENGLQEIEIIASRD